MCKSSEGGKALSRILCSQMINNAMGLNASHVAGVDNILADRISRIHTSNTNPEFATLMKKINEHTNVPRKFDPIGSWVNVQRREFRQLEGGKYSALTNERRDKLDSIGFSFNIHKKS
eukprot:scaffold174844_cov24-Attheya_sp.AAC.1